MATTRERYTAVAVVLHWAIAAAILFMLPLGFWMHLTSEHGDGGDGLFRAFQLHKSIGLSILGLSLVRLGWRLANPPPPLPAHMPAWERFAAKATHWAFYVLMVALPLSGWLFVSAGWSLHEDRSLATPTIFFGLFRVPPLFDLPSASADMRESTARTAFTAHWLMAYAAILLAALHVAAALKHHFADRDEVLSHMVPGVRAPNQTKAAPSTPGRLAILGAGLGLVAVAASAAIYVAGTFGESAPPRSPSTIEIAQPVETPASGQPGQPGAAPAPTPAGAPAAWRVDSGASAIAFAYIYSDESGEARFNGRFTRWRADIRFDPDNLDASSANIAIETASAQTGVAAHDSSLPQAGWFNAGAYPTARFVTTSIRRSGRAYEARGDLTIRDRERAVTLPFTLAVTGDRAVMDGRVSIDRRDFGVGDGAEGDDLISRQVELSIHVEAVRQ